LDYDVVCIYSDFTSLRVFYLCRIQLGQPATVKVAANLVRLLSYNNKVWP